MVKPKVNSCLVCLHLLSFQLQLLPGVYEDWEERLAELQALCKCLHPKCLQQDPHLPAIWLNSDFPDKVSPSARSLSPACPRVPFRWPFCRLYLDCKSRISIRSIATRCISTFSEGYHFNVWLKSSALFHWSIRKCSNQSESLSPTLVWPIPKNVDRDICCCNNRCGPFQIANEKTDFSKMFALWNNWRWDLRWKGQRFWSYEKISVNLPDKYLGFIPFFVVTWTVPELMKYIWLPTEMSFPTDAMTYTYDWLLWFDWLRVPSCKHQFETLPDPSRIISSACK